MRENRLLNSAKRDYPGIDPLGEFQSWIFVVDQPIERLGEVAKYFGRDVQADPNLIIIQPAEDETTIKIEQVRGLHQIVATRSLSNAERLILISPAESISVAGQQALLKLLEEPPEKTIFALVTRSAASLPETVRSRCRVVQLRQNAGMTQGGKLAELAELPTFAQRVNMLASFPTDREELKQFLVKELALPVPATAAGISLKARALAAYEALQVNVSPSLVIDSFTDP